MTSEQTLITTDALTAARSTNDPGYLSLRPLCEALGLSWPESREHSNTPIPRERAIVRVPPAQESGDHELVPAARAEEDVIYIPMRPIPEALGLDWPNALVRLRRAPPLPNEEPHD